MDEFSLRPANLPLQKNVSIQEARLIQTPVFIAAGSGGSFVFARPTRSSTTRTFLLLSPLLRVPRVPRVATQPKSGVCTRDLEKAVYGKYVKQTMNNSFHFLPVFCRQSISCWEFEGLMDETRGEVKYLAGIITILAIVCRIN